METNQTFEIEGLSELMKALEELPDKLQDKIVKSLLQKTGRKFIVNELKSALPYSSKSKKGLRVISDRRDKEAVYAGVSGDSFWLRFAELGTKERTKGHYRGRITPKNQVRDVIDAEINPIIDFARDEFGNEINIILERRIKKINKSK